MSDPTRQLSFYVESLQRNDSQRKAKNARGHAGLAAWSEVLDALGWSVALRRLDGSILLSRRAHAWVAERGLPVLDWDRIATRVAEEAPVCQLVATPQLLVWQAGACSAEGARGAATAKCTPREYEVLQWIWAGKTGPEIALILGCAQRTVESHVARIYRKLGVHSRAELLFERPQIAAGGTC